MRLTPHPGLRRFGAASAALALIALSASGASAQLVFDGNILFNNNATGTLAGQFTGAPTAGSTCPIESPALTAAKLGTLVYTHNAYADPLLPNAPYVANTIPNFQPALGSPAFLGAVSVPNDGFFEAVCYKGAIGPNLGDDWTQGWTYWDSTGANRQDLHLAGMPDPRPLAVYDNIRLNSTLFWSADSNYEIRNQFRVLNGGVLFVAPDVVVFGDINTLGTMVVDRGGRLYAVGNACQPIVFTSNAPPGSQARGQWGGINILGRAKTNIVNSCAGDSGSAEGGAVGFYGGSNDADNSGALRYVRCEFSGKEITANNELNAFMWCAAGTGTRADYLQAFRCADDDFEVFGGTLAQKHLIGIDGTDDGYDSQMGSRTKAQFVIVRVTGEKAPASTNGQVGERGIEADNNEFVFTETQCSGRSWPVVSNFTLVGDKRTGANFPGATQGAELRRGTAYTILNSIVTNFKSTGIRVSDDATWNAHCAAVPAAPTVACPGALGVETLGEGNVFVARGAPNPFRNSVTFSFALAKAGPVSVEIYSADGRRVDTLVNGERPAGPQSVTWNLNRETPSGMYFYKVVAGNERSTGKLTRLN